MRERRDRVAKREVLARRRRKEAIREGRVAKREGQASEKRGIGR